MEMSPFIYGFTGIGLSLILLALGIHIMVVLGMVGFAGIIWITGSFTPGLQLLQSAPYFTSQLGSIVVIPLFVFMGFLTMYGEISTYALRSAQKWIGGQPGGLLLAVCWACVGFGAVSGASIAAATVFTKLALPEMKKMGYDMKFASGGIAAASEIAMLIPPSILLIIYAMLASQSIARLLIGGIGPGLLLALTFSIGIYVMAKRNPQLAPGMTVKVPLRGKIASLSDLWPIIIMIFVILGGIYSGVFTPNEAASAGTVVAFIFALARKSLTWQRLKDSLLETVTISATLIIVLIGATIFSRFLALSGFTVGVAEVIAGLGLPSTAFIIFAMIIYFLLGLFIDPTSSMALTLPVFLPVIKTLGIDPIWFGLLCVTSLIIGGFTPPFGIVVFAVKAAATGLDISTEDIFRGALPFVIMALICLAILVAFPEISTFLPSTIMSR
ncbi:TRAP transporter large permease [Chloroflexota bacterium]